MKLFSLLLVASLTLLSHAQTGTDPIAPSSQNGCVNYYNPFYYYTARSCPITTTNSPSIYPPVLTNENVLPLSSLTSALFTIDLPFPVTLNYQVISRANISYYGYIQFFLPSGLWLEADVFGSQISMLNNNNTKSFISTGIIGQSPNSIFVVRWSRLTLNTARQLSSPPLFSFDAFLYENSTNMLESRYYRIDQPPSSITITSAVYVGFQIRGDNFTTNNLGYSINYINYTNIRSDLLGNVMRFSFLPNMSNADPIAASNQANCQTIPDSQNFYSVQSCPIYSGSETVYAPNLVQETRLTSSSSPIFLPFPVTVYGFTSNRLTVSLNGLLQFGSTPYTGSTIQPIPSNTLANGAGPVIAPFSSDLDLFTSNSNVKNSFSSMGYLGTAPNQIFVIRYSRVTLYNSPVNQPWPIISFDVWLFENSTTFQIRYYKIDALDLSRSTKSISVGVQGNNFARYIAVFNSSRDLTGIKNLLEGNILSFSTGDPINTNGGASHYSTSVMMTILLASIISLFVFSMN